MPAHGHNTNTLPAAQVRGHRLVDAAVFEPVPFRSAVRDGCTHVLVLSTRPAAKAPGLTGISKHVNRLANDLIKRAFLYEPCECMHGGATARRAGRS